MIVFGGNKYETTDQVFYFGGSRIGQAYIGSTKIYPKPVIEDDDVIDAGGSTSKENLLRFTVAWSFGRNDNCDLDTHAALINTNNIQQYHVYFSNKMQTSYTYTDDNGNTVSAVTGLDVDNVAANKDPNIENINWREGLSPVLSDGYVWCWTHQWSSTLYYGFKSTITYITGSGDNATFHRREYNYPYSISTSHTVVVAVIKIENSRVVDIIDGSDIVTNAFVNLTKPSEISSCDNTTEKYPIRT